MIADYLTKPLQGGLFKRMRDTIMGLIPFPTEEHVEKNRIVVAGKQNHVRNNDNTPHTESGKLRDTHRESEISIQVIDDTSTVSTDEKRGKSNSSNHKSVRNTCNVSKEESNNNSGETTVS